VKVLLDSNIILDVLLAREPKKQFADKIFRLAANDEIEAAMTASSITDVYYIVAKRLGDQLARKAVRDLLNLLQIIAVNGDDGAGALDLPMPDFEDALVSVCADKEAVDYIITNDKEFLTMAGIPSAIVISSEKFIASLGLL